MIITEEEDQDLVRQEIESHHIPQMRKKGFIASALSRFLASRNLF
jgi:hypothetical protein